MDEVNFKKEKLERMSTMAPLHDAAEASWLILFIVVVFATFRRFGEVSAKLIASLARQKKNKSVEMVLFLIPT